MIPKTFRGVEIFCKLPSKIKILTTFGFSEKVIAECENGKYYIISQDKKYTELKVPASITRAKNVTHC